MHCNACSVQGGADTSSTLYYNPLYVSDERFGGYRKLPADDRRKVRTFVGLDTLGLPTNDRDAVAGKLSTSRDTLTSELL